MHAEKLKYYQFVWQNSNDLNTCYHHLYQELYKRKPGRCGFSLLKLN